MKIKIFNILFGVIIFITYPAIANGHEWKPIINVNNSYIDVADYNLTFWQKFLNDGSMNFKSMDIPKSIKDYLKNKKIAYLITDNTINCSEGQMYITQMFYMDENDNDILQIQFEGEPFYRLFYNDKSGNSLTIYPDAKTNPLAQPVFNLNNGSRGYCELLLKSIVK